MVRNVEKIQKQITRKKCKIKAMKQSANIRIEKILDEIDELNDDLIEVAGE